MAAGFLLFPLSKCYPRQFGPSRELMVFLVLFFGSSFLMWPLVLVIWALWPLVIILGLFVPSMTLEQTLSSGTSSEASVSPELMGSKALCVTDLKPTGKIKFRGKRYHATCINDFIPKGAVVRIVSAQGFNVVVEKLV